MKGFPDAIEAIYPATTVQTCIVHLIRQSLRYVPRKDYDKVVQDLRPIYTAVDADAAQQALERFDEKWGARFPVIIVRQRASAFSLLSSSLSLSGVTPAGVFGVHRASPKLEVAWD